MVLIAIKGCNPYLALVQGLQSNPMIMHRCRAHRITSVQLWSVPQPIKIKTGPHCPVERYLVPWHYGQNNLPELKRNQGKISKGKPWQAFLKFSASSTGEGRGWGILKVAIYLLFFLLLRFWNEKQGEERLLNTREQEEKTKHSRLLICKLQSFRI